jgi:hypothetical protein
MIEFLFRQHQRLCIHAALLFAVGLFLSWPVIQQHLRAVAWLPMAMFRLVLRMMGRSPSLLRMACAIWLFNSAVMFLDMASGFHPLVPKILAIWTGLNVAVIVGMGDAGLRILDVARPKHGAWVPPERLGTLCAVAVMLIELPCFFLAIAMGLSLGGAVQDGVDYLAALQPRAAAYAVFILPALLISAVAEAVAIRSSAARWLAANDRPETGGG